MSANHATKRSASSSRAGRSVTSFPRSTGPSMAAQNRDKAGGRSRIAARVPRRRDHRHRLAVPPYDRSRARPRRLRHVPGQPERGHAEPAALRVPAARGRCAHPYARAPRSLRSHPRAGRGRLRGPDLRDRRDRGARGSRPPRRGEAADRVRETVGAARPAAAPADERSGGRAARAGSLGRDRARGAALHRGRRHVGARSFPRRALRRGRRRRGRRDGALRRRRPHPRLGDHRSPRAGPQLRVLRRHRQARHADRPRPDGRVRRGLRPHGVDVWRPRARALCDERRGARRDVRAVGDSGGVLLVPAFAIGRTQDMVYELDRLLAAGRIPKLPLYLDSPMASKATDIYRRHSEYFDDETRALLTAHEEPLDYPGAIVTNDPARSRAIHDTNRPYMIVASNGMLTGGRRLAHLPHPVSDPAPNPPFLGYQGEGTLGAHLQGGATKVVIDGASRDVRCRIVSISGFSAHADEPELLAWIGAFANGKRAGDAGFPRTVFITHGDPPAETALEPKVRALGFATHVAQWRDTVTLD